MMRTHSRTCYVDDMIETMHKHTIQTRARRSVYFWEYNADKPRTVILVHGFRGTHHGLELIAEQLADFRIIIPDLPGFGESDTLPDGHTLEGYVAFLDEFKEAIEPRNPSILLGHSFGSILVAHYAAEHPTKCRQIILVNPIGAPALEGNRRILTQLAVFYYWLGRVLPKGLAKPWLASKVVTKVMSVVLRKTKDKSLKKYIDEQHFAHFSTFANPSQLAEAFDTSVRHDVSHAAPRITTPTLLIVGEKDDITPLKKQHVVHKAINGSQIVIIPDVGHLSHYETPEAVADAVRSFI